MIVPNETRLYQHYRRLNTFSLAASARECKDNKTPARLADEFLEAVTELKGYDNRQEPFHPPRGPLPAGAKTRIYQQLCSSRTPIPALKPYLLECKCREINPLRTTNATFQNGKTARRLCGPGGIDYVALREGKRPVLGEIKWREKNPYYALVQLLTYLSQLASQAQQERANTYLFCNSLQLPLRFDLHILLVDYNRQGEGGPIVACLHRVAADFILKLKEAASTPLLGDILCLSADSVGAPLKLDWAAYNDPQ